jgi:hypothetical protein
MKRDRQIRLCFWKEKRNKELEGGTVRIRRGDEENTEVR